MLIRSDTRLVRTCVSAIIICYVGSISFCLFVYWESVMFSLKFEFHGRFFLSCFHILSSNGTQKCQSEDGSLFECDSAVSSCFYGIFHVFTNIWNLWTYFFSCFCVLWIVCAIIICYIALIQLGALFLWNLWWFFWHLDSMTVHLLLFQSLTPCKKSTKLVWTFGDKVVL